MNYTYINNLYFTSKSSCWNITPTLPALMYVDVTIFLYIDMGNVRIKACNLDYMFSLFVRLN